MMWVTSRSRQLKSLCAPSILPFPLLWQPWNSHAKIGTQKRWRKHGVSKSVGGREHSKSLQTISHWPNLAPYSLFLYTSETKNDFYIFKWLGGKSKRRIIYCDMWNYRKFNFSVHKLSSDRDVFICLYIKFTRGCVCIHDRDHLA